MASFGLCQSDTKSSSDPQVLGKRLVAKGFDKAYILLGQFLVLKKNQELFTEWLKDISGANAKQATDCFQCLKDWCDEFL